MKTKCVKNRVLVMAIVSMLIFVSFTSIIQFASAELTADMHEPNDDFDHAVGVNLNATYDDLTIYPLNDVDYFTMYLTQSKLYKFSVWGTNETLKLSVFFPNQTLIAEKTGNSTYWLYCSVTGGYYIKLEMNEATCNYTFIVNENDYENADDGYESNDVGANAKELPLGTTDGLKLFNDDWYYYTTGTNLGVVNITLSNIDMVDPEVPAVFGVTVVLTDPNSSPVKEEEIVLFEGQSSSVYVYCDAISTKVYFRITNHGEDYFPNVVLNYGITLGFIEDDVYEPNNLQSTAATFMIHTEYKTLKLFNQDVYNCTITGNTHVIVNITCDYDYGMDGITTMDLFDEDGLILKSKVKNFQTGESIDFTIINTDDSIKSICLQIISSALMEYRINIKPVSDDAYEESNDVMSGAVALETNMVYSNLILMDNDWYSFELNSTQQTFVAYATISNDYAYNNFKMKIYNSAGEALESSIYYTPLGLDAKTYIVVNAPVTAEGKYYLFVSHESTFEIAYYELTLQSVVIIPDKTQFTVSETNKTLTLKVFTGMTYATVTVRCYDQFSNLLGQSTFDTDMSNEMTFSFESPYIAEGTNDIHVELDIFFNNGPKVLASEVIKINIVKDPANDTGDNNKPTGIDPTLLIVIIVVVGAVAVVAVVVVVNKKKKQQDKQPKEPRKAPQVEQPEPKE